MPTGCFTETRDKQHAVCRKRGPIRVHERLFLGLTLLGGPLTLCAQSLDQSGLSGSTVSFSGAVDLAIGRVKNKNAAGISSTTSELHANGITGSLFRFRGREDLGGGLYSGFWLESTMQPDTGAAGALGKYWSRTSAVYAGGPWGEIGLGRLVAPTFTNMAIYDPVVNNGYLQAMKVLSTLGTDTDYLYRNDNAVSYFLPRNLGGFTGHVQITAGEGEKNKGYKGVRFGYVSGPLDLGIAAGRGKTTPGQPDYTVRNMGASYDLGYVRLSGYLAKLGYGALNQREVVVGAVIPVQQHVLRISYAVTTGNGNAVVGTDSKSYGLSYVYNLSARTALFATWARISNEGVANFRLSPSANTGSARGGSSTGYDFGIRHFF